LAKSKIYSYKTNHFSSSVKDRPILDNSRLTNPYQAHQEPTNARRSSAKYRALAFGLYFFYKTCIIEQKTLFSILITQKTMKHVGGKGDKKITLYALSTCPWCRKTKALLDELGVAYDFEDVDLLSEEEDKKTTEEISKWTDDLSFPLLVIDDKKTIQGFQENEIRKELA
jgi:glutaredoxin-like protein NrdH